MMMKSIKYINDYSYYGAVYLVTVDHCGHSPPLVFFFLRLLCVKANRLKKNRKKMARKRERGRESREER
jgi:hypothetical protein